MNTHRVAVLFTESDLAKVKAAAGRVPLSRWLRDLAVFEANLHELKTGSGSLLKPDGVEKPEAEQPAKKNSKRTPPPTDTLDLAPAEPRGTRAPGGKERCTYQPMGDKVCPRCHKVHSKV